MPFGLTFAVSILAQSCSLLMAFRLQPCSRVRPLPAKASIAASGAACPPMMLCADPSALPSIITSKRPAPLVVAGLLGRARRKGKARPVGFA